MSNPWDGPIHIIKSWIYTKENLIWYLEPSVLSNGIHSSCIEAAILKSQLLKVAGGSDITPGGPGLLSCQGWHCQLQCDHLQEPAGGEKAGKTGGWDGCHREVKVRQFGWVHSCPAKRKSHLVNIEKCDFYPWLNNGKFLLHFHLIWSWRDKNWLSYCGPR